MNRYWPVRICLVPRLVGVGGMVSFQHRLAAGLAARGVAVTYDLADPPYNAVLVIGGTRQLPRLLQARQKGIPIIQRLNGMNWLHRVRTPEGKRRTSLRHWLRAEWGNALLAVIRRRLARHIVYQSRFSQSWWERVRGPAPAGTTVIYNGVDLESCTPDGPHERPDDRWRVLLVEGSLMGGYEHGLEIAAQLGAGLAAQLRAGQAAQPESQAGAQSVLGLADGAVSAYSREKLRPVELMVVGRVAPEVRRQWDDRLADLVAPGLLPIHWAGLLPGERIPEIDRSAHLLYSADLNAACPNSVIEALACGLPVLSFDTGALAELVPGDAGRVVPYGGDPWKLEPPGVSGLVNAAQEILLGGERFRAAARDHAEANFGLQGMVDKYLEVLLNV